MDMQPFPFKVHAMIWCVRNAEGDCSLFVDMPMFPDKLVWSQAMGELMSPRVWFRLAN